MVKQKDDKIAKSVIRHADDPVKDIQKSLKAIYQKISNFRVR